MKLSYMDLNDYDLNKLLTGDGRRCTRERLLSGSFIGIALACKMARLLRSVSLILMIRLT